MTIRHHPLDDTLAAYAAGTLTSGPSLVLRAHIAICQDCRRRLLAMESIGGALLAIEAADPLPEGLLARTLARLDALPQGTRAAGLSMAIPFAGAPASLKGCMVGRWRFVQPGLRVASVTAPGQVEASAMLIKVGAGRKMPRHTHDGIEYTQVLKGAFSDAAGLYGPGDYLEGDEAIDHQPIAASGQDCLCLAAVDGRLRMTSLIGRVAQSLFGF